MQKYVLKIVKLYVMLLQVITEVLIKLFRKKKIWMLQGVKFMEYITHKNRQNEGSTFYKARLTFKMDYFGRLG